MFFYISLLISIIFSIILANFQISKGFTYEFALLVNIIIALFYPIYYVFSSKEEKIIVFCCKDLPWQVFTAFFKNISFIFIFPIIQLFFITKVCDPFIGIMFYLLLPITSFVLIYSLLNYLIKTSKSKKIIFLKYYLILLITVFADIYAVYSQPQVFAYNVFFGYFQGSIYDVGINISKSLIFFNIYKISIAVVLMMFTYRKNLQKQIFALIIFLSFTVMIVYIYFNKNELYLISTREYIKKELKGFIETEHFKIYYSKIPNIEKNIKKLSTEHEIYFKELEETLKIKYDEKITSYIFKDSSEKKKLMGAGNTLIAKPWLNEIYINYSDFPHPVLKHELIHIFFGKIADNFLKVAMKNFIPQIGIIEGSAVAFEDNFETLNLQEKLHILYKLGKFPNIENLISYKGFWGQNNYFAYQTTGAFFQFLHKKYGIEIIKKIYKNGSFDVLDKSIKELTKEWIEEIKLLNVPQNYISQTEIMFSQPSIFQRVCPHIISKLQSELNQHISLNDFAQCKNILEEIINYEPENYQHYLTSVQIAIKLKQYKEALNYLSKLEQLKYPKNVEYQIKHLKGDIFWLNKDETNAKNEYKQLLTQPIDDNIYRNVYFKLSGLENENIKKFIFNYLIKQKPLKEYIFEFDKINLTQSEQNIVNYLYGRNFLNQKRYKEALFFFERITEFNNYTIDIELLLLKMKTYLFTKEYEKLQNVCEMIVKISKTLGVKSITLRYLNFVNYYKELKNQ